MQQAGPAFNMSIAWGAIVVLAIAGIGGFLAIRHLFGGKGVAIASLLVLGAGFVSLLFMSSVKMQPVAHDQAHAIVISSSSSDQLSTIRQELESSTPTEVTTPPGPTPSKILHIAGSNPPIEIPELPTWRKNPPTPETVTSAQSKYVLTSQQFATVEEAEAELYPTLMVDVQQRIEVKLPSMRDWKPTQEDIRISGLITEKVIETIPLKVGEFEAPVQRVSWLMEFGPQSDQYFQARWYPLEAQRRSKLILALLAGASGVFGVSAFALRRRREQPAPAAPAENQMV